MGLANALPAPSLSVLGVGRTASFEGLSLRRNKARSTTITSLDTAETRPLPSTQLTAREGKGGNHVGQAMWLTLAVSADVRPLARHVGLVVGRVRSVRPSPSFCRRRIRQTVA